MISVLLQGGLGNQLFQVAAAASIAKDINTDICLSPNNHTLNLQGNSVISYKTNVFSKINFVDSNLILKRLELYNEVSFSYKKIIKKDNLLLNGYFQSEKYFASQKEHIKLLYSETEYIKNYIEENYNYIDFKNSASIHVRRGDYLKFPKIHPTCDLEYYKYCINNLEKYDNLLIFSDDINWCKKNLKYNNITFIENEPDYIDLYLMSRCRDNIIANSSFSWWAAWLNNNSDKKVFCPSIWFGTSGPQDYQDIFCEGWIKV